MDWDRYITSIVTSKPSDWLRQECRDWMPNPHHTPGIDDPNDANILPTVYFLRKEISISIRLPSRAGHFVANFLDGLDYERLPNAQSYFDSFDLMWCGTILRCDKGVSYSSDDTFCFLPDSQEVSEIEYRLFKLMNLMDGWFARDLSTSEKIFDQNFALCGRRIVSANWPCF